MEYKNINLRNLYIDLLNKIKGIEGVDKEYVDDLVEVIDLHLTALDSDLSAISSVIPEEASATNPLVTEDDLPPAPVNADWNALSGLAQILNKPTIPAAQVNSDWNATSGVAEILNKPTIPAAQVNSDWNATSGVAQILNKPSEFNTRELVVDHRFWGLDSQLSLYKYTLSNIPGVYDTSKASSLSLTPHNALRVTSEEEIAYDTVVGYDITQNATTFELFIYSTEAPDSDFYVQFNYWK